MPEIATIVESITIGESIEPMMSSQIISVSDSITVSDILIMGPDSLRQAGRIYNLIDFNVNYEFPELFIKSLIFIPGGTGGENVVVRAGAVTGPVIANLISLAGTHEQIMLNIREKLVLDKDASTVATGGVLVLVTG